MTAQPAPQNDQHAIWNGPSGAGWVAAQSMLDAMFKPFEDQLRQAAAAAGAQDVLEVGCGTGAVTLAIAEALAPTGRCTGVDISEPMLARARSRAEHARAEATFLCADAGTYAFEPARFDMITSRFGVMFFDDAEGAFANLRRAAKPGAALHMIVWRSPADNPFMTTAERAAAPLLPDMPPRRPDAPGQFAFADPVRVNAILDKSGWTDIDIAPNDVACAISESDLDLYLSRLGPVGAFMQTMEASRAAKILATIRKAFEPFLQDGEVRFTAACWTVTARAPAP